VKALCLLGSDQLRGVRAAGETVMVWGSGAGRMK